MMAANDNIASTVAAIGSVGGDPLYLVVGNSVRATLDNSGNLSCTGGVDVQGVGVFSGGVKLTGPASLAAAAAKEWSYEHPVTRYYFGDGTGYSFVLSKRVSGVTSDLLTMSDSGNLSVTGAGSFGGVVSSGSGFQTTAYTSDARNRIWSFGNADAHGVSYFQGASGYGSSGSVGFHFGDATANGSVLNVLSGGGISVNGNTYARLSSGENGTHRGLKFGIINDDRDFGGVTMKMTTGEVRYTAGYTGWGGYHTWYTNGAERMILDGSGVLSYGIYTGTPGTITGYIEIKDIGGTVRKLAVIS